MEREELKSFCAAWGASGVAFLRRWRGCEVFEAGSEGDRIMPRFIILKDGAARWSTSAETLDILMEESEEGGCEAW